MARTGAEPLGSMGTDTPISSLSTRPRLLFDYFHQLFAQVTNPPLDAIREELVTSLAATIGPEGNLLDPGPASCRQIVLPYPVIDNDELAKLLSIDEDGDLPGFKAVRVSGLYPLRDGAAGHQGPADRDLPARVRGDRGRRTHPGAVRPRLHRRPRADPVAAAHRGRAPAPGARADPHPGRAGGRVRRLPRGAPRRRADRVRRRRGQPVPGLRERRRPDRHRRAGRHRAGRRRSATTSRRSARAS